MPADRCEDTRAFWCLLLLLSAIFSNAVALVVDKCKRLLVAGCFGGQAFLVWDVRLMTAVYECDLLVGSESLGK